MRKRVVRTPSELRRRSKPTTHPKTRLTFRELGAAASFAETVLFAFDFASVAGKEALFTKNGFAFRIEFFQRASDAEFTGVGLTGNAAAANGDDDVDNVFFLGREERRENGVAELLGAEEFFEFAVVDADATLARADADASDRRLTAAGAEFVVFAVAFNNVVAAFDHFICSFIVG